MRITKTQLKQLIKEEISKVVNENSSSDILNFLETNGFLKIKSKEEYLKVVPILTQAGYSLVGGREFFSYLTPFDSGRKLSIYLTKGGSKNNKYLQFANYIDKNKVNDKFPIGTPYN